MARPIWKGNISFGLVNIPISLYSAEKKSELHFKLLDRRNRSEIHYERVNERTGQQVPAEEIVKGYEYDPGEYVILTDEDFRQAAPEATQAIEITDFATLDSIPYAYFEKPYYVVPGKKAEKGYVLLRETLRRTGKVALAKVVIRSRQYLSALIPQDDALVLNIMRYYQELREPSEFEFPAGSLEDYKVSEKELEIAEMLVDSMTNEWDPKRYHDEYRDALMKWIEQRARSGGEPPPKGEPEEKRDEGKVIDMMDLLRRSVQQASRARGGEARTKRKPEPAGRPGRGQKTAEGKK